jgi:hypothetical protein
MRKVNVTVALVAGLILVTSTLGAQNSIDGHWEGVMVREGAELRMSFDFVNEATGIKASFNSPTQRALSIPLRNVTYAAPNVHFLLVGDITTIIFDGQLSANTIMGQFREGSGRVASSGKAMPEAECFAKVRPKDHSH